jgi:MoaA/NifB/PqqE/SkfB family radical SAM enzyme
MLGNTNTHKLCAFVFNSIALSESGKISNCCASGLRIPQVSIDDSIESIINNPLLVEIRESMLVGKEHTACNFCWKNEKNGVKSEREYSFEKIKTTQFLPQVTNNDIKYLDLFLGNKCNLACRMCYPISSSLLSSQMRKIYPNLTYKDTTLTDIDKQKILEIIDNAPNLNRMHLWGGEPLIIDFFDELCEHLISTDRAKNIQLDISTNLQTNIERKFEYLKHFKKVGLSISIDGLDDTYEYIRWPGNFNKVIENVKILSGNKNIHQYIQCVVQNLNVHNLTDFIDKISEFDYCWYAFVEVTGSNFIEILPYSIIEKEIEKLQKFKNVESVQYLIKVLSSKLESSKTLDRTKVAVFFKKQRDLDGLYGQNLFRTHPHFLELANQFNIEPW